MSYEPFQSDERKAEQAERGERAAIERAADVLFVMNNPGGRRFAHRLLVNAGVFGSSFSPDNPHQTSFNEGQRNMGLILLAEIMDVAPTQYATMLEEAKNNANQ